MTPDRQQYELKRITNLDSHFCDSCEAPVRDTMNTNKRAKLSPKKNNTSVLF